MSNQMMLFSEVPAAATGSVVTSGLVLYLDAANTSSYPGSGTTWTDLSGSSNNGTLTSATYNTNGGGAIATSGNSGSYVTIASPNLAASNFTVMTGSRYSGATRGRVVNAKNNNWLVGHWNSSVGNFYATGWVTSGTPTGGSDTNWRIYSAQGTIGGEFKLFINNAQTATSSAGGLAGPNGLSISKTLYPGEDSTSECAFILAYNRVLTETEMTQNYNFFKTRLGL